MAETDKEVIKIIARANKMLKRINDEKLSISDGDNHRVLTATVSLDSAIDDFNSNKVHTEKVL
jgi:hypothetical protein